jgi:hypothetical protein
MHLGNAALPSYAVRTVNDAEAGLTSAEVDAAIGVKGGPDITAARRCVEDANAAIDRQAFRLRGLRERLVTQGAGSADAYSGIRALLSAHEEDARERLRLTIFPAAENNAQPFIRQRSYRGMVGLVVVVALRAVVSLSPVRLRNRLRGPLMEGLSQELRTTPSPMHPMLLATGLGHRSNPTVLLDLGGVLIAVALCSKGSDQSRNQHLPRARQRIKDDKIGVGFG